MTTWQRLLGIVGGLGPHAHIAFERCLLEAVGEAREDQDYPPWILSSLPQVPDRTRALVDAAESPVDALAESLRRIRHVADFAVIPCNTAHAFLGELRQRIDLPLVDVVATTVDALVDRGYGPTIGLLATDGTLASGVYPRTTAALDTPLQWMSLLDLPGGDALQESLVMASIYGSRNHLGDRRGGLKGGELRDPATGELLASRLALAAETLWEHGCSAVVAGCSEISMATESHVDGDRWIDPMRLAAERCIRIARGTEPVPD